MGRHIDAPEHFVGAKILVQFTNFQCGNVAHPLQPLFVPGRRYGVIPTIVNLTKTLTDGNLQRNIIQGSQKQYRNREYLVFYLYFIGPHRCIFSTLSA